MIGRLVEEQGIWFWRERPGESRAARFAARKPRWLFGAGQAQLCQKNRGTMQRLIWPQTCLDIGARGGMAGKIGLLRQVTKSCAGLDEPYSVVRLNKDRGNLQRRRFATAMAPDKTIFFSRRERKRSLLEQRLAGDGERDILQQ